MSEARARLHWGHLGRELKRLREFAGLTQRDVADALKVAQTTVDRVEKGGARGGRPPSWRTVREWAQACSDAAPDMGLLREMTASALDEHTDYRNLMSGGLEAVQADIAAEEASSGLIRNFCPDFVPALLQTEEYARRVLSITNYKRKSGLEAAVQARMGRQEILRQDGHRLEFVTSEAGLRWPPGPAPVLAEQLEHLSAVTKLPSVTLSVIRTGVRTLALPGGTFVLYEERVDGEESFAAVEGRHKRLLATEAEDVAIYQEQYDLLRRSAVSGSEAHALISAASADLRRHPA